MGIAWGGYISLPSHHYNPYKWQTGQTRKHLIQFVIVSHECVIGAYVLRSTFL